MTALSASNLSRVIELLRHDLESSTHLYLIRHGQTEANVRHQLAGHLDVPLDELGRAQAKQVGVRMSDTPLDAIIASPLQRARITAGEVARHQKLEPSIDDRIREMHFGHAEGLTMPEALLRFPELASLRDDPLDEHFGWPGGDVRREFHARILATFTSYATDWHERHVAVVCHGGVIGSLIAQLDGGSPNDYASYPVANCSVTHLEVQRSGTTIHVLNDTTHLDVVRTEPFTYTLPDSEPGVGLD